MIVPNDYVGYSCIILPYFSALRLRFWRIFFFSNEGAQISLWISSWMSKRIFHSLRRTFSAIFLVEMTVLNFKNSVSDIFYAIFLPLSENKLKLCRFAFETWFSPFCSIQFAFNEWASWFETWRFCTLDGFLGLKLIELVSKVFSQWIGFYRIVILSFSSLNPLSWFVNQRWTMIQCPDLNF